MQVRNSNFYPENYILPGNPKERLSDVRHIVSTAKNKCPEIFEGNRDYFSFQFRYVAPFEKNFRELKRLQGCAASAAGRRNEFKGYITIDLSSWVGHHDEEYLNAALLFMVDMSDCWKYIFLIDNLNAKASRDMVCKVLTVFARERILCRVKEPVEKNSFKQHIDAICKEQGIVCSAAVSELLEDLMEEKFDESIISAILAEAFRNSGNKIVMNSIPNYKSGQNSVIRYMLTQKEYDRFTDIIERYKEKHNEKSEEI